MTFINEQNLYKVIFQSRKKEAEKFTDWVTGEVLPSIRKNGGYLASNENDTPETIMARAVLIAQQTIERQKQQLEDANRKLELAAPKVAFAETFATSSGNILIRDFAKQISQALGLSGFGQNQLFRFLRENGYMNMNRYPSQYSTEKKLIHVTEGLHQLNDGSMENHHTPRITPKGQLYFFEKIKKLVDKVGFWWEAR